MKRIAAFLLVVVLVVSIAPTVFASTTTLTTTVPATASYTLNIPADQSITFGKTETEIGNITVTDGKNFAEGKNVEVTVAYGPFTCDNTETTIPYTLRAYGEKGTFSAKTSIASGRTLTYKGLASGGVEEKSDFIPISNSDTTLKSLPMTKVSVIIESASWGQALPGDYSSVITFTAAVVQP